MSSSSCSFPSKDSQPLIAAAGTSATSGTSAASSSTASQHYRRDRTSRSNNNNNNNNNEVDTTLELNNGRHSLSTLTTRDTDHDESIDHSDDRSKQHQKSQNSHCNNATHTGSQSSSSQRERPPVEQQGQTDTFVVQPSLTTTVAPSTTKHHQRQLTALQSWSVFWGAYCRRTATKENQDGWFVLRSVLRNKDGDNDTEGLNNNNGHGSIDDVKIDGSRYDDKDHLDNHHKCRTLSHQHQDQSALQYRPHHWGCWCDDTTTAGGTFAQRRPSRTSNQAPSPNTMNDLSNRVMAINLDSSTSSAPQTTPSQDDSQGGSSPSETPSLHPHLLWSLTCRRPWVFGVLDGHGSGGRLASHEASKALTTCIQSRLSRSTSFSNNDDLPTSISSESSSNCPKIELKTRLCQLRDILVDAFLLAQEKLLASNVAASRDFGTTAVVTACVGRYIITATCGDSSAILVVCNPHHAKSSTVIVNVQLSVDHTLLSAAERARISSEGKGRIVVGDGGVHRLIPGFFSYEQAKMKGLSINMARALGHFLLSKCSLSPQPQLTLVDLSDIYQTLQDLHRNPPNEMHSYLFEAREFDATLEHKFKGAAQVQSSSGGATRTTTTGTTDSGPLKSDDHEESKEIEFDGVDEQEGTQITNDKGMEVCKEKNGSTTACEIPEVRERELSASCMMDDSSTETTIDESCTSEPSDDLQNSKKTFASDSSSDDEVVVLLGDESPVSDALSLAPPTSHPIVQCTASGSSEVLAVSPPKRMPSEEISSQRSNSSRHSLPTSSTSSSTKKQCHTPSGGKRRRSLIEELGEPPSPMTTTTGNWGMRARDAVLDWLSPDDDIREGLENQDVVENEGMSKDDDLELTQEGEKACEDVMRDETCVGGGRSEGSSDNTNLPMACQRDVIEDMSGRGVAEQSPAVIETSKTETTGSTRCETDQSNVNDDEWKTRHQDLELLAATSKLVQETTALLILMSDGVSDVLSRTQVGELALMLDKNGNTPEQVSELITYKAAQIRRQRGFRADNCTCVVVKLRPCLDG